jgi:hypothetical protein
MYRSVISWQEFRAMALYRKFIVGMMLAFALWMLVLTALFIANGAAIAALTLVAGVAIGGAALTVVPSRLGSAE